MRWIATSFPRGSVDTVIDRLSILETSNLVAAVFTSGDRLVAIGRGIIVLSGRRVRNVEEIEAPGLSFSILLGGCCAEKHAAP